MWYRLVVFDINVNQHKRKKRTLKKDKCLHVSEDKLNLKHLHLVQKIECKLPLIHAYILTYCSYDRTGFGNVALSAPSSFGDGPTVTLLTEN